MGTDIHGWVQVREYPVHSPEWWQNVIKLEGMLGRNYGMFGQLFGVRNYEGFAPLAEERGIPDDYQSYGERDYDYGHSQSWIGWRELVAINWDEESNQLDERISEFSYDNISGAFLPTGSKFMGSSKITPEMQEALNAGQMAYSADGRTAYKHRFVTRRESLSGDWQLLFSFMKQLHAFYLPNLEERNVVDDRPLPALPGAAPELIRMVVWFDS